MTRRPRPYMSTMPLRTVPASLDAVIPQGVPPDAVQRWMAAYGATAHALEAKVRKGWTVCVPPGETLPHTSQGDVSVVVLETLSDHLDAPERQHLLDEVRRWPTEEPWEVAKKVRCLLRQREPVADVAPFVRQLEGLVKAGALTGEGAGRNIIRQAATPGEVMGALAASRGIAWAQDDVAARCREAWDTVHADLVAEFPVARRQMSWDRFSDSTRPLVGLARWAEHGDATEATLREIVLRLEALQGFQGRWEGLPVGRVGSALAVLLSRDPALLREPAVQHALDRIAERAPDEPDDWARAYAAEALRQALRGLVPREGLDSWAIAVHASPAREAPKPLAGDRESARRALLQCILAHEGAHFQKTRGNKGWKHVETVSCVVNAEVDPDATYQVIRAGLGREDAPDARRLVETLKRRWGAPK